MVKCGIYGIVNKQEKKVYIGKSNDIERRWKEHKNELSKGTHRNKALQESYNNYGADAFIYKIIELCPESQYGLIELEYINKYATKGKAYNVYSDKDELRFQLASMLIDNYFYDIRIDEPMGDCLSEKGKPLKIALYGRYNDDEIYIHIYSMDYERNNIDTRYLYCNSSYDKYYYEVGYSIYEKLDVKSIVCELVEQIKIDVGC